VTSGTGTSLNGVSLNIGETDVIWTAVDFAGNTSNCLIKITVLDSNLPPVVTNYQFTIKKGTELSANLLIPIPGNSNQIKVTSLTLAAFGQLNLSEQGQFTYTPFKDFVGEDHFIYQVCKPESSSLCASAEVTILVIEDNTGQVNVPDSFSPNGDGINEYFKIKGLSGYPDAILKIFTRSGVKVFEQKNYGNTDFWGNEEKAWWDGRTDSKWNIGNSKLAPATYVYTLELERGKVLTGTVYLNY
jgi:gliding motility-associated-like protein